ncbi:MAG: hypothetical protein EZS28_017254 [Streblomastix strix]|uniref:Tc1-like transposase DDE domain-containing protein n=1 Tax=Streblomastix strix TaxID=222440 RepID=A0A5J4VY36_9EUKA|nr:MAG: hypothetical protein EZS28_017254 [Streblomastix strix]
MTAQLSPDTLHRLEERAVLKHYWMLGKPALEAHANLAQTYPKNHPEKRHDRSLTKRLRTRGTNDNPPYSPDLAPSDFWLFGELKGRMRGHIFETQQQLADFCTEFAERQSEDKLKSVFDDWQSRCLKIIDNGGEYLF